MFLNQSVKEKMYDWIVNNCKNNHMAQLLYEKYNKAETKLLF